MTSVFPKSKDKMSIGKQGNIIRSNFVTIEDPYEVFNTFQEEIQKIQDPLINSEVQIFKLTAIYYKVKPKAAPISRMNSSLKPKI